MDKPELDVLETQFDRVVSSLVEWPETRRNGHRQANRFVRRRRDGHAQQESERRFRRLLDALPAAVYTTDVAGRITYFNEAAAALWGHRPVLGTAEWCGSWKLYWPDGTPLPHDQCPMAKALRENRPIRGMEAVAQRPDGTLVPFIPYPTPLHDGTGRTIGAVNMLVDITERKRAEEQQALLVRELHHRVRNTLATVQAIMSSTAHACASIDEFKQAFMGRIACLSKTHALLTDDRDQAVSFRDLLASELDAFDDGSARRIRLAGPQIELPSRLAVPLGMAIHELTTNAAKYGALSELGGAVEVRWSRIVAADGEKLDCEWREQNGPAVQAPKRRGFGSRLLHHVLEAQTRAEVTVDYRPDGLRCRLVVPLSAPA